MMNEQIKNQELVFESDNGIISLALQVYSEFVGKHGGNKDLLDRVNELSIIFRNKDSSKKYDLEGEEVPPT